MATLGEYFDDSDDSSCGELDLSEEQDCQFTNSQIPDFYMTEEPGDGELFIAAVEEIKQVCYKAKRLLGERIWKRCVFEWLRELLSEQR